MWLLCLGFLAPQKGQGQDAAPPKEAPPFMEPSQAFMKQFCLDCHSKEKQKGELDLEAFMQLQPIDQPASIWESIIEQIEVGEMPPAKADQPDEDHKGRFLAWVDQSMEWIGRQSAGDPGPVVMRRLNNAELDYTLQDLTGIAELKPSAWFPTDSAAGAGFMNTGQALVMSPALLEKYFEAAKTVASHAVLLPDGFRFSQHTARRDWTEEVLQEIRNLYATYTTGSGGQEVNLQGIVFDTNQGGGLPIRAYCKALIDAHQVAENAARPWENDQLITMASSRGLSPKYLFRLRDAFGTQNPSPFFRHLQPLFMDALEDEKLLDTLITEIMRWQGALWTFQPVGHIGKLNGPQVWMEPRSKLQSKQSFEVAVSLDPKGRPLPLHLSAQSITGYPQAPILWSHIEVKIDDERTLPLASLNQIVRAHDAVLAGILPHTEKILHAIAARMSSNTSLDIASLASDLGVERSWIEAWLDVLGYGASSVGSQTLFIQTMQEGAGYDFIRGWGSPQTPSIVSNHSDQQVRIPGKMRPQGVAVHPSPTEKVVIRWQSLFLGELNWKAQIQDAHPECGNGVEWSLKWQRGSLARTLSSGRTHGDQVSASQSSQALPVRPGDMVSLEILPRDGNHACDLTDVRWELIDPQHPENRWDLSEDVASSLLDGNPHADSQGNPAVWSFHHETIKKSEDREPIPHDSLLAQWMESQDLEERHLLARLLQQSLMEESAPKEPGNASLRHWLTGFNSPLAARDLPASFLLSQESEPGQAVGWSLENAQEAPSSHSPELRHSSDHASHFILPADATLRLEIKDKRLSQAQWSLKGQLASEASSACVQLHTRTLLKDEASPPSVSSLKADAPLIAHDGSPGHASIERHLKTFRELFPAALCYHKIVPVDEVVTLKLFYREDHHLKRLMLTSAEADRLDRLWHELHFISQDALTQVDAYEQLWQYATQDADPSVFEPLRQPILDQARRFKEEWVASQPMHVSALIEFAPKVYRRALSTSEIQSLKDLYTSLRKQALSHEEAFGLMLARLWVSPAFLFRMENPPPGAQPGSLSDRELASRLSYFLWSSTPDTTLLTLAEQGTLSRETTLRQQVERMLLSPKVRRLANEFATAWLQVYDLDLSDEKDTRRYPEFESMKAFMKEEVVRFFADLFQNDRKVQNIWDDDRSFLNQELAAHYGMPFPENEGWMPVNGMRAHGRGGILGFAATLARHSGASRTSPILRGHWISETLLGETLPPPPANVPELPENEDTASMSIRALTQAHSKDPRCAGCHQRIDPFGMALEGFDTLGRQRQFDQAGRPIEEDATLTDGHSFTGLNGLKAYLLKERRDDLNRQLARKLLGYALGRSIALSDKPWIDQRVEDMKNPDYSMAQLVEAIVLSPPFRSIRGRDQTQAVSMQSTQPLTQ